MKVGECICGRRTVLWTRVGELREHCCQRPECLAAWEVCRREVDAFMADGPEGDE